MDQISNYFSNINSFDTPQAAAIALAENTINRTRSIIQQKGRCVWAVSGGSSILKIYDALTDHSKQIKEFGSNLIVTWVDERAVPHSHQSSNFGNAREHFWYNFEQVHCIPVPFRENVNHSAREFQSVLHKNNIERGDLDITILGMGTDGHTASLFPGNKVLKEHRKDVIAVEDPSVEQPRISMTFPMINSSNSIYLYLYGTEKGRTLREAVQSGQMEEYPILGIDNDKAEIYSDQDLKIDE